VKKAVFFDIDGTLWDFYNVIPESTVRAIRALRKRGHYAFICSGRARSYIQNPNLLDIGFDGVVAACGTHVELDDTMVYEKLIDKDLAEHTVKTVRSYGFRPILEGPEHLYMDDADFGGDVYGKKLKGELGERLLPIAGLEGQWKINKLSCATDNADREGCFAALDEYYTYLVHNSAVVELVPKGHTKATGMQRMCEALGIPREDTVAFGDSVNDLDMLRYAGVGVAMGNGSDEAKDAADFVTANLDADGIYNGLERLGLL
jgi:hypothetical protein